MYATSDDGGVTWTTHGDIQLAAGANFDAQHSHMYLAPDNTTVVYTDEYGVALRSTDGGSTWNTMLGTVLGAYTPVGASGEPPILFDMAGSRGKYAVPLWATAAPHLYHSSDNGATWTDSWTGHGVTQLNDVAAGGATTIFYAAGNEGVLRSGDSGATWKSVGVFQPQLHSVVVAPTYNTDGAVFSTSYPSGLVTTKGQDANGFGIFRARSDGSRWTEPEAADAFNGGGFGSVFNTGVNGGYSLAVSPNYANDHTLFEGDVTGTVNISNDGGATWTSSNISNQEGWHIYALAVSPAYASDHVVYAGFGNLGYGFARSNDGGQTWMSMVPAVVR